MICPDPVEDQEAEASAAAVHAEAEADLEAASVAEARAAALAVADLVVRTTDRHITDRPIFTAPILVGAGTDRAITAAVAEAVSMRF